MTYGQRLKMWRQRLRLSQRDVCAMLGVARSSVTRVESNKVTPESSKIAKLMEMLYRDIEMRGKEGIPMNAIKKAWK